MPILAQIIDQSSGTSLTHLPAALVQLLCFYYILTSTVIYY